MEKNVILFDLDGTLLPMDQELFTKSYFKKLAVKMAPLGYAPEKLINAIWCGIKEMVKNNGTRMNEEVFWEEFAAIFGEDVIKDKPYFETFYRNEFQQVKGDCGYNPMAAESIRKLKQAGYRVALATNPIFPSIATESRIRWAGLEPEDFEIYTTYENTGSCKPNPQYYLEVAQKLGVVPEQCIMIGNDVTEDMIAKTVGMDVFLLTDCIINKENKDIEVYPHGGFEKMLSYILN